MVDLKTWMQCTYSMHCRCLSFLCRPPFQAFLPKKYGTALSVTRSWMFHLPGAYLYCSSSLQEVEELEQPLHQCQYHFYWKVRHSFSLILCNWWRFPILKVFAILKIQDIFRYFPNWASVIMVYICSNHQYIFLFYLVPDENDVLTCWENCSDPYHEHVDMNRNVLEDILAVVGLR